MILIHLLLQPEVEVPIPGFIYYAIVLILIWSALLVFNLFEIFYSNIYNRPFFRNLFIYKKLSKDELLILQNHFSFYNLLSKKQQSQFEHRVASFLSKKQFYGRDNNLITDKTKVTIAALGCMLSFGRRNYKYKLIRSILVYPDAFYSTNNQAYHNGEFNPKLKVLALSQKAFEEGYEITNDNMNLGIHEFMHAMHAEAKVGSDVDSHRFNKQFKKIITHLQNPEVREKLDNTRFFRAYAFENEFEFMAVLAEYFIESPEELKQNFPQLYMDIKNMLGFHFLDY